MQFTSVFFLLFLTAVFALHWALPPRFRWGAALASSLVFYLPFGLPALAVLLACCILCWGCGLFLARRPSRKGPLFLCLLFCLAPLLLFKYTSIPARFSLIAPVGISFYTFKMISYLVEVSRGELEMCIRDRTYTLQGQQFSEAPPAPPTPEKEIAPLTGRVYDDMHQVVEDLIGFSNQQKHDYFKEHGYEHFNFSGGNDTYRSYLFNTVYGGSWPEVSAEFCEQYGLPTGLYIQPYIGDLSKPDEVVVFATSTNAAKGNWYTTMVCIDGVWYHGKKGVSVTMQYEVLKKKITSEWDPLI